MLPTKLASKSSLLSKQWIRLPAMLEEEYYQEVGLEFVMIEANFGS